jgi:uncharacterized protein VirK/YbjX
MFAIHKYSYVAAPGLHWKYINEVFARASVLTPLCNRRHILSFIIDSLAHPTRRAEWFAYLDSRLPPGIPLRTATHVVAYTARRYLRYWFSPQARIDIFRSHYDLLSERFSLALLDSMQAVSGLLLGELIGKSGRRYTVTLHFAMTKEGEIGIRFNDVELGTWLATIRGTFGRQANGDEVFWVGAIQGAPAFIGREEISHATRDLNVLRPKQVVLHAACALCASVGVETVFLPSNRNHVARGWWRRWFLADKISSDYDGFWREFTTQRTAWGDYRLSLPLPRRKLEDVQSKRRKDWLRRHARLDALTEKIAAKWHK